MTIDSEALQQFFGAYFHQDWALDASSPEQVLADYFHDHEDGDLRATLSAIRQLLAEEDADDRLAERLFREFWCYYDPRGLGQETRTWLNGIVDQFEKELARRQSPAD